MSMEHIGWLQKINFNWLINNESRTKKTFPCFLIHISCNGCAFQQFKMTFCYRIIWLNRKIFSSMPSYPTKNKAMCKHVSMEYYDFKVHYKCFMAVYDKTCTININLGQARAHYYWGSLWILRIPLIQTTVLSTLKNNKMFYASFLFNSFHNPHTHHRKKLCKPRSVSIHIVWWLIDQDYFTGASN